MFRIQKISDHGTSTPAVARTALQGHGILRFFDRSESEKEAALAVLLEIKRHLVKCVEIHDELAVEISAGHTEIESQGFVLQSGGRAVSLPGVRDLQSKSETFLQSAKLAIAETGNLVKPFYGVAFGHKYHNFSAWTNTTFGDSDEFSKLVRSWEPYVKRIVKMRNAVAIPGMCLMADLIRSILTSPMVALVLNLSIPDGDSLENSLGRCLLTLTLS